MLKRLSLSPDLAAEIRRILSLAWPVALTSFNWTILQITDVAVVGLTGTEASAAFGASRTLTFVAIMVGLGCLTGVLVHVSRADGAGDAPRTGAVLHQGVVLAAAVGTIVGLALHFLAGPMLAAIGVAPEIAPAAADVVRVMAIAYPFQLLMIAASFFLEGVSRPRRVMVVNLGMLPLNALLAWAWSGGHFGLPRWEAVGAASATALASAAGAVGMLVAVATLPDARERGVGALRGIANAATLRGAGGLLAFGIVPAFASGLELAGFSILIVLSTQLGEAVTHAFQIVFSIHNVSFGLALGLGSAAGVRAGNAVGEGRRDDVARRATIAAVLAAIVTGALALVALVLRVPLVDAFPASDEVHRLAIGMLLIWAPFILFDAVQVVFVYTLRSLGDQVAAGLSSILAFFVVTGGMGVALVHGGFGPNALVVASVSGMVAAAVLQGGRLAWVTGRRPVPPRS